MLKPSHKSESDQRISQCKRGCFKHKTMQENTFILQQVEENDFNDDSGANKKIFFRMVSCQENV